MRNEELLRKVLEDAFQQVISGKGAERHGGEDLLDQPWRWIADAFGEGFLVGQAVKKAHEASQATTWAQDRWEREMLGAIAYLSLAVLRRRLNASEELPKTVSVKVVNGVPVVDHFGIQVVKTT